jgi:chemotaxis signal transduction protein
VLPVVDLRLRLGIEASPPSATSRIVVVSSAGRLLGLLVDSVRQVEAVLRSQVQPPPESVADVAGGAVDGVVQQQDRTVILLDLATVLRLARPAGEKIA